MSRTVLTFTNAWRLDQWQQKTDMHFRFDLSKSHPFLSAYIESPEDIEFKSEWSINDNVMLVHAKVTLDEQIATLLLLKHSG